MDKHPIIALFEGQAEMLDLAEDHSTVDDAIARLAGWMEEAGERLNDTDKVALVGVGALLYRARLNELTYARLAAMGINLPSADGEQ